MGSLAWPKALREPAGEAKPNFCVISDGEAWAYCTVGLVFYQLYMLSQQPSWSSWPAYIFTLMMSKWDLYCTPCNITYLLWILDSFLMWTGNIFPYPTKGCVGMLRQSSLKLMQEWWPLLSEQWALKWVIHWYIENNFVMISV